MDWLKTVVFPAVGYVLAAVVAWIARNREAIEAIFLRVQKDAADGLTGAKLEDIAVEKFFESLYPKMPFYVKFVGEKWWEARVRKLAKYFCKKAKLIK